MFHAVDALAADSIATGSRVAVRWSQQRQGGITDIACFDLIAADDGPSIAP
jgi:hypothetical protein